jgi:uncharacterized membrane protein YfcA
MRPAVGRTDAAAAAVGLAAGLIAGLFGVGGGVLIVPGLWWAARMEQRRAHGTSLAAMVPMTVGGVATYLAGGHVDWAAAASLAVGSLVGAWWGAGLLARVRTRTLTVAFVAALVVSAVRMLLGDIETRTAGPSAVGLVALAGVGLGAGLLAGLLGIGGGIVTVPVMTIAFGFAPVLAKGTSLAVIVPTALVGTVRNARSGNLDARSATVVGLSGVVSAALGAALSARLPDAVANALFGVLLLAVSLRLVSPLRRTVRRHGRE